jgi:signal transduction histidine kinase/DNA-binding response OmpR family regulator
MADAEKANILVVDDLPEKLLVIESILAELDENVVTVRSGEEALRRVLQQEYAVILLDVNMPGMDGLETAALIRSRKKSAHTPIIFITAFADEMHTAQGYSLGAVDYILSPVVPEVLRTKVRVFVELHRMTQQARRQGEERVVLAREQAARVAAEDATRRSAFLAEASRVLATSLDLEAAPDGLLRLAVPYLGDWGAVTLVEDEARPWRTEAAWLDPIGRRHTCSLSGPEPLGPGIAELIGRVLATAHSEQQQGPATLPALAGADSNDIVLGPILAIPLLARGRALGTFTLAMSHSHRSYAHPDAVLAEDLAGRAAIAVDNARLYRDIQRADRHKNEFLSMLAHELRNPLAPIRNAVQIMRVLGSERPELAAAREMIDRQVQHMVRLVDDLLDVSRITRGKIRLQTESVEVAAVVARALETARPLIDSRRHELTVEVPEAPLRVDGDSVRLAQVVGNLLNNAAKYTEEGGRIWLTVEDADNQAVIRVRDSGMGIPADMLSSIFDLFTQVERSLDRSQGGLGIGLTLVKNLVEMHGGKVEATSAGPNQGSEFVLRLPLLAGVPRPAHVGNGRVITKSVKHAGRRVLVVDDHVDAAESLAQLLRMAGHEVHVAHSASAALEQCAVFEPEVVFLDIGLPGMDGYAVARRIRAEHGPDRPLLVALTGYGQDEDRKRSLDAGFDQHLVKPADPARLATLFATSKLAPIEPRELDVR